MIPNTQSSRSDSARPDDFCVAAKPVSEFADSSETLYQQKQHPGVLCAIHPEKPFDFAEKAYWMQRDVALKAFVDQWLHIATEDGSFRIIYAAWFD